MNYQVGEYRDQDTGRTRWAVYASASCVWVFPRKYGRDAARILAARLNRCAQ